jgi:phosphoglycolate phosphatase-like HAD superfamily hydrolase
VPDTIDLRRYRMAVFDCDGVVLDSNRIKTDAFRAAVSGESPALADQFVEYHKANGGISRYVKFDWFYRELANCPEAKQAAKVEAALSRYASIVREQLLVCNTVPGVLTCLAWFAARDVPCYINSGGDQAELREVFAERGLAHWFRGIYGSPATKLDNLAQLRTQGELCRPGVFFGDARSDLEAARAHELDYIYVRGCSEWADGPAYCDQHGLLQCASFIDLMAQQSSE